MPYIKPGLMFEAQILIADLVHQHDVDPAELNDGAMEFLNTNPVTGNKDTGQKVAKVNGVWVDKESVDNANWQEVPIFDNWDSNV